MSRNSPRLDAGSRGRARRTMAPNGDGDDVLVVLEVHSDHESSREENTHKKNIFKTLRWKLRRGKRNKRSDSPKNNGASHQQENNSSRKSSSSSMHSSAKHSSSHARIMCPVPSLKKLVKREPSAIYCDIDDDDDEHTKHSTKNSIARCWSGNSSSDNSDQSRFELALPPRNSLDSSNATSSSTNATTTTRTQDRSVGHLTNGTESESQVSSSHSSNEARLRPNDTETNSRTNDCSNGNGTSSAVVPSYGMSASTMHLYESVSETPQIGSLALELEKLSKCGWYWGPITRGEAEEKLADQPDGAFLVRDSSDDHYLLSLSFRSYTRTFHTRIEHCNGLFSFYSHSEPDGHASIVELIQQSMKFSKSGAFCYSRSRSPEAQTFPVRLTRPISRFTQVRSLQYLCRFTIRQYTRLDLLQKLPIPASIKGYLEQRQY